MRQETGIVIDTPDGIAHFQMANAIMRLRFEVKTGMNSSRGSTLQFVRQQYGIIAGTKKKALRLMEEKYLATYGWAYGEKPEVKDERLFIDAQGGRVTCIKHIGGYGRADVEAYPEGTSKTVDGQPEWITPLDVWVLVGERDLAMYKQLGYAAPTCEDCRHE